MITEDKLKTPVWGRSTNPEFARTRKASNPPSSLSVTRRQRDHKGQIANPCLGRMQPNQSSYAPEKQAVPPLQTTSMNVVTTTCAGRKQGGCNRRVDVGAKNDQADIASPWSPHRSIAKQVSNTSIQNLSFTAGKIVRLRSCRPVLGPSISTT